MQKNVKIKIIAASLLFVIMILLLFFFLKRSGNSPENSTADNKKKSSINEDELKRKFPSAIDSLLLQFGIKKDWIENYPSSGNEKPKKPVVDKKNKEKIKTTKSPGSDLWFNKKVSVPLDLSVAEVNIDLNNYFKENNSLLSASEDPKKFSVISDVYLSEDSTKKLVGKITFNQVKELKRNAAEICIVMDNLDLLPEQDMGKILLSPEKFTVVLPFDIEKSEIQSKIFDSRKDYILIFETGSEKDVDADFRSDMKPGEWKSKIKSISYEYGKSSAFILSARRSIPKFESDIKEEFSRYNIKLYLDTIFVKFESKEKPPKKVNDLISDINVKTNKGYRTIYYLVNFSADDLAEFGSQIFTLKKKGFRFRVFSDLIKRQ